jgi:hypothetical protein
VQGATITYQTGTMRVRGLAGQAGQTNQPLGEGIDGLLCPWLAMGLDEADESVCRRVMRLDGSVALQLRKNGLRKLLAELNPPLVK